jgi:hypothetical protein
MSLLEQQNFLAKLYTDENVRRAFLSEPEKIGKENNLSEEEIADLQEILPDEINAFADSLFYKRLREVERFLPLTRKVLEQDFENHFREFSRNFNPKSVKKHLEDAIEFTRFLQEKDFEFLWLKDLAKIEKGKLEFSGYGKKIVIEIVNFDLRNVFHKIQINDFDFKRRKTFAVWLKIGKNVKHFFI